jgi:hypothetical protein
MSPRDLLKRVKQRPFIPFRLVVSEGGNYDVRHPEQVMVTRDLAVIGIEGDQDQDFYETTVLVDLLHVVRLEPLETTKPSGDGQSKQGKKK